MNYYKFIVFNSILKHLVYLSIIDYHYFDLFHHYYYYKVVLILIIDFHYVFHHYYFFHHILYHFYFHITLFPHIIIDSQFLLHFLKTIDFDFHILQIIPILINSFLHTYLAFHKSVNFHYLTFIHFEFQFRLGYIIKNFNFEILIIQIIYSLSNYSLILVCYNKHLQLFPHNHSNFIS